ncbi:hypothetical protein CLV28_0694 [Sediminihabitans luteus]|uniref:Uncharacterized protein n=1 Tax=Sediminihabitans luteus TaxID=1138585 RepID=A0A2M9D072_9CELL|nr:hypothetical protein [Sediminihabitans luteus]PJJ77475.1 hypothetical protein CLV28_0694 [Sediminihabitans luteus]GII98369.1 hypothetical protein Slu03_07470 [Sediminihabitans luteus]
MMNEITADGARALAALVSTIRPAWGAAGVLAALADARHRGTAAELAHAAITAATTPEARTPAVIAMDGPHWHTTHHPASSTDYDRCTQPGHGSFPAWNCGACRSEDLEGQRPTTPPRAEPSVSYEHGPRIVRAAMTAAGIPTTRTQEDR